MKKPTTKAGKAAKVTKVMSEFSKGQLNIGKSPKKVTSPKQAVAIALSKKGMALGGMVNSRFSPISKPQRFLGVF